MRRYETITLIDPDLSEEDRQPVLDRISELISNQEGFLVGLDHWGSRKLAYEIKKKSHGYYLRIDFCGTGTLIEELERFFRIDDRILKYMTVLLEKDADIESIKAQIAQAQKEAAQAALSSEPSEEAVPENTTEREVESESDTEQTESPVPDSNNKE